MLVLERLPDPDLDWQFYDGVPLKRLIAWIIDFALILIASFFFTIILTIVTLGYGWILFPAVIFGTSFFYRWLTLSARSATFGMMYMGIELRSANGALLDPRLAAWHTGLFMLLMASVIGAFATMAAIASTRYGQGLPDLIFGTTAINRPVT